MTDSEAEAKSRANEKASDPFAELEAKTLARMNARTLKKINDRDNLTPWNEWVLKSLDQEDWIVCEQSLDSYKLPNGSELFLTPALCSRWKELAAEVRDIHNQTAGLRVTQAEVVMAGDTRVEILQSSFRDWGRSYVAHRIARTNYRSSGPIDQFSLIHAELVPKLEEIAFRPGSANRSVLSEISDYITTKLFETTLRDFIEIKFDRKKLLPAYRVVKGEHHLRLRLGAIVEVYQWHHLNDVSEVLAMTRECSLAATNFLAANNSIETENVIDMLQMLADDIQEMRPFLRHNFNPENLVIDLAPDLVLFFRWAVGRGIGIISFAASQTEALVHLKNDTSALALNLTYSGLLSNYATPWIDSITASRDDPTLLLANLRIVENIHTRLHSLYKKVDRKAVLERFLTRSRTETGMEEPSEEEFAAICQTIAEPLEGPLTSEPTDSVPIVVNAIRVQRLIQLLSEKLSCEIRQGKGSEIVLYRIGGHHFRLGHHKRNSYVATPVIRNLLRRLGISIEDWIAAIN